MRKDPESQAVSKPSFFYLSRRGPRPHSARACQERATGFTGSLFGTLDGSISSLHIAPATPPGLSPDVASYLVSLPQCFLSEETSADLLKSQNVFFFPSKILTFKYSFDQWFSNVSRHKNHLEGLLKHRESCELKMHSTLAESSC